MERMKEAIDAYVTRGRVKMAEALADGRHRVVPRFEDLLTVGEAMLRHLVEEQFYQPPEAMKPGPEASARPDDTETALSNQHLQQSDLVGEKFGKPKRIAKRKKAE